MRLNKYISKSGLCSRRQADKSVQGGSVTVNGSLELNPAYQVTKDDDVRLDGQKIMDNQIFRTILMNKPEGYITTMHDPLDRKTVMDLVDFKERLYPIGRLDKDTSGLLLLTNNGHLANQLTHPKNKIPRIYELEIDKPFENWEKRKIAKNVYIGQKEWGRGEIIEQKKNKGRTVVLIRLYQGKKREIRRIIYRMKRTLFSLKRVQFGPIRLDNTPIGSYRDLYESEIKEISSL
ncbi:MAG: pseudouridine synthase [Candidatus Marinimicrobia bacterium]|nr:pseudouridine synthase [Candidatus Neomarinimicrobiota bacterium]|tara:strand:- start:686 stop:1387 length:702 start_codon:yes stop_codon:yes gene_type:complete